MNASWYEPVRTHRSLGSTSVRPGSLAGLAEARKANLGQFFTPDALAALVWRIGVEFPSQGRCARVSILDNSVGSGRLLQFARPGEHLVAGCDVHQDSIDALISAAEAAKLDADFINAGMEEIAPADFDVALINPPFSLHLDSPTMQGYSCTTWGRYGPNSAASSHAYALHQALDAAAVVVAILPSTYAAECFQDPSPEMQGRLRALIRLPRGSFLEEGTMVDVSLLVFGADDEHFEPVSLSLESLTAQLPDLSLSLPQFASCPRPLSRMTDKAAEPSIRGAVTGGTRVRVVHNGRHVHLKFGCAFMEAKVLNRVLHAPVAKIEGHRYPRGVTYAGQGRLDVELWLLQDDPAKCLAWLENAIRDMGGTPVVDPGLRGYLARRIRRHVREATPFGHVVRDALSVDTAQARATAKASRLLDPMVWGSPLIRAGEQVDFEALEDGGYRVTHAGESADLREDEMLAAFDLPKAEEGSAQDGWAEAHPSREELFPELAHALRCHLQRSGAADVAGWDYQLQDMVELTMGRHGLAGWRMGCGKGRLAIAMCLAGGKANGIVVEAHLIDELVQQLQESNVDAELWQVITTPEQCESLRKINIISYNRLRMRLRPGVSKRTYAHKLRRRFSRLVADEAHLLRNTETEQTRALWQLSPRRRLAMSGTPLYSYVQNLLPLAQWVYGDGTAVQPYGRFRAFLEPRLWESMSAANRGIEKFAERHVVTEWVTRAWEDGMQVGAKRQVPKINNIEALRTWAAPLIKRRHETEPMVSAHFNTPEPSIEVTTLDWHPSHLSHYLVVADEFAEWYQRANDDKKNINLVTLLARIGAVEKACNHPAHQGSGAVLVPPYTALTSKHLHVLARLEQWAAEGHKSICYVDGPASAELYVRELAKRGIEAVPFHGELSIKNRTRDMNARFRNGDAPVLVASKDTIQNGLNLWQANRGIFAARSWGHTQEEQMMRRLLRPQQYRDVHFEFVNLRGSIDEYQAQMVAMKGDTAGAALDFLTPEMDASFIHLDQILDQFVEGLAERAGLNNSEFRDQLKAA